MTEPPAIPAGTSGEEDPRRLRRALIALCITEITSWGVLYYAFPVMLDSLTRATGWSAGTALSAFSTGLLVSAACGVVVGRLLERYGPRPVMTTGSVLGVAALLGVVSASSLPWFFAAWAGVGVAQSMLLYPPAFAALTHWYGPRRVRAITTLSLVAGLASTVFAPPTAAVVAELGWRKTYLVLAVLLGVVTIPLHAVFLTPRWRTDGHRRQQERRTPAIRATVGSRAFACLAISMALAAFGLYGATVNLVPLLTGRGISNTLAAIALGLIGAGQVLGRLGYPALTRRTSARTRTVAVMTIGAITIAVLGLLPGPVAAVIVVAICAGAARGTYTLLQATAVSDRWGTRHYAVLNGIAIAPATAAMALGPAGTALLANHLGGYPAAFCLVAALILAGACTASGTATSRTSPPS
ncbi:MAG: MFS transporter [Sciscionella sp.]